jgi:S-methylmethionine-dependent homocysteine/selenocysteine methylase
MTDSGLETTLIFIDGVELPEFAAFVLKDAITLLADLRERDGRGQDDYVISGCIGPRGDGYDPAFTTTPEEAERYHAEQIGSFADTEADLVSAR